MSETFQVAHVQEQGQQVILILVSPAFSRLGSSQQQQQYGALQRCATASGMAGTVALVWDAGGGRVGTYGPTRWQGFLESLDPLTVQASINKKLTCG